MSVEHPTIEAGRMHARPPAGSLRRSTARTPGAVRLGAERSRKATLGGRGPAMMTTC